jgi:hypothetical protein
VTDLSPPPIPDLSSEYMAVRRQHLEGEHEREFIHARRRRRAPTLLSPRRRLIPLALSLAVAVTATVLIVGTDGTGPQKAFAGWSATPTPAASGQLQAAEAACAAQRPTLASLVPTVVDTRGPTTLLVYADGGVSVPTPRYPSGRQFATACATGAPAFGTLIGSGAGAIAIAGSEVVPHIEGLQVAADGQGFGYLDGQVGPAVTAVTLVLDDGSSVQATTSNGWFGAWWPGNEGAQSAQITTATGTTTQPLNGYSGAAGSAPVSSGSTGSAG